MYDNWGANIAVVVATIVAVSACVAIHYEGLEWLSRRLPRMHLHRRTLIYAIFAIIGLHITEIWTFGLAYTALLEWPETGRMTGLEAHSWLDNIYFSAVVYTTLGLGDIAPRGPIRFMAGTEALTGFVLIAWSASFTYLEMERRWRER